MKRYLILILAVISLIIAQSVFAGLNDLVSRSNNTGAMAYSLSAPTDSGIRITQVIVKTRPAVTAAEAITCSLDSAGGSNYDGGEVSSGSMAGESDWIQNFGDDGGYVLTAGDAFKCIFTNTDNVHWYITVNYVKE